MAGPWIIGGRQMAGEIPEQAIRRCFKRETGLDVPENRFHFVLINNYIWKDREQEPQNVGSHNFALTFYIELSEEERTAVKLVSAEYEEFGLREFSREDLIREGAHQALIDLYDNVFIS
jgi:ADP-ribose pyrophosphatase YjhB (NUDIX family)